MEREEQIEKRLTALALKKSIDPDELIQSWYLEVLQGKSQKQTLDQFLIDYLRKTQGRSDLKSRDQRVAFNNAKSENSDGTQVQIPSGNEIFNQAGCAYDYKKFVSLLPLMERASLILTDIGFEQKEIGFILGVSAPRISQFLKNAHTQLEVLRDS